MDTAFKVYSLVPVFQNGFLITDLLAFEALDAQVLTVLDCQVSLE